MSIKEYRKKAHLTQRDVASLIDVSQGAVSQWELGVSIPSVAKLKKMSQLFKCSIEDLLSSK